MPVNLLAIQTTEERRVLRAFREAIQSVRDQATIQEIVRLLEVGNVDGVIELLQLDEATFEPLEEAIRQAYRTGGLTGAEQIGNIPIEAGTIAARFSVGLPTATAWLGDMSSRLITEIVEEQRVMVRERLTDALARGVNPRQSALDLVGRIDRRTNRRVGGFVGLTRNQAQWVANARNELEALDSRYFTRELRDKRFDATVRRAIEEEKPLTATQVNRMITAMQSRTLQYRGQIISRSESITALRAGQYEAIRQAAQRGGLPLDEVLKSWDAHLDARTRLDHVQMEQTYMAEPIPFNQAFVAPDLSRLLYPGDSSMGASGSQTINCRCRAVYRIDWIGRQVRVEGFG